MWQSFQVLHDSASLPFSVCFSPATNCCLPFTLLRMHVLCNNNNLTVYTMLLLSLIFRLIFVQDPFKAVIGKVVMMAQTIENYPVTASNISCCGTLFNATFTVQDVWHKIHGLHKTARPSSPKLLHTIQWYNPRCQPEKRPHIRKEET